MNDQKNLLLKDLQQLQRQQNPPSRFKHIGFNHRRKQYNQLRLPTSDLQTLEKAQQVLLKDIKDIDNSLQKKHSVFRYQSGYLFAQGISNKLPEHFQNLISTHCETLENGFALWRFQEQSGAIKLVSGKLSNSPPSFGSKLTQKSLQKLRQYNHSKCLQSRKIANKPWDYFSKGDLRIKTQADERKTEIKNAEKMRSKMRQQTDFQRKYSEFQVKYRESDVRMGQSKGVKHSRYQSTIIDSQQFSQELSFKEVQPRPTVEELRKMLLKQNKILSVWTPPTNYPQLLAVLSLQIRQKQLNFRVCWISKYFFLKHSINRRLFICLLQWLSVQFEYVQELILTTTKHNFDQYLSPLGWKLSHWLNQQRVRVYFKRPV